jgi:flavin-dependent dehydrogenase
VAESNVIVVGAGPVGLTVATQAAIRGQPSCSLSLVSAVFDLEVASRRSEEIRSFGCFL